MSTYYSTPLITDVFDTGKYKTQLKEVKPGSRQHSDDAPPKPLLIATPVEAGEFPLVLFLHGYLLCNSFYSQLIRHIASHGFIVIAPQLYTMAGCDASVDIQSAAAVTDWLSEGLSKFLPPNVTPNFAKLALAGHSRGGKAAFALALRKLSITTKLKFSALIGVDPVDGRDKGKQTQPPVLTYVPHSFDLDMAALVIGASLSEQKKFPLFPACAPKGVNHKDFYNECRKPAWYFLAEDYGHFDMLDDQMPRGLTFIDTLKWMFTFVVGKNGKTREPMRRFVGGLVVAFLRAYLLHDSTDLLAISDRHESAPVEFKSDCLV